MRSTPPAADAIRFPDKFQGIFHRTQPKFAPLLAEARRTLAALPMPVEVRPYYERGVLESPQPSFMLLPLMYLSLADHLGGVAARHRRYLPWLVLAMEACAILDDSVDYTPRRSGRSTMAHEYGDATAAAFAAFLVTTVHEQTAREAPELSGSLFALFRELCALETWEVNARYPNVDIGEFEHWLRCRYGEVTPAVAYGFDGALLLRGENAMPEAVNTAFAEIFQDVDDLVNVLEDREHDGENSDLKMGMVTYPLLSAVRASPTVARSLETLWSSYRGIPRNSRDMVLAGIAANEVGTADAFGEVLAGVREYGVSATVGKIVSDATACLMAAPESTRSCIAEMLDTFVDRLARVPTLPELERERLHRWRRRSLPPASL